MTEDPYHPPTPVVTPPPLPEATKTPWNGWWTLALGRRHFLCMAIRG
jgi:hypothetical protein